MRELQVSKIPPGRKLQRVVKMNVIFQSGGRKLLLSFLIRFRLKLFVLDNEALVAASADLSFGIVSGNIKNETASVYLDKFCLAPYGHSKRCRCVVCHV